MKKSCIYQTVHGIFRRTLAATKIRGVRFREGNHDYVIQTGGLRVFPRLIAAEHHTPFRKTVARSGNEQLDTLLGGGLHYGTSNLLIGPAGSGKSTIASMFAHAAAKRGEQADYYVFDETVATLCENVIGFSLSELIVVCQASVESRLEASTPKKAIATNQ